MESMVVMDRWAGQPAKAVCRLMCVAGIAKACYALDNAFRMP
jgi:hypothetical protein